jgi:hypothetical protein
MLHKQTFLRSLLSLAITFGLLGTPLVSAPAATSPNLGVQKYDDIDGVDVVLLSVKRSSGNLLYVRWQYRNNTATPKILGKNFSGMGSSENWSLTWDFYVMDGATKYGVARDSSQNPIAATHAWPKTVTLGPKRVYETWAKVNAPPPDVAKMSVYVPDTEPFEDVPISP